MSLFFELILSFCILFLICKIITTKNVVESVLFLILLAINFSVLLFLFNVNFLGVLYLAVYIGAVAVFFLFVVMMTDLNNNVVINEKKNETSRQMMLYFIILFCSLVFSNLIFTLLSYNNHLFLTRNEKFHSLIDNFSLNIEEIGFSMFNEHAGPFILMSIIILIALIGAIFITTVANNSTLTVSISINPTLSMLQFMDDMTSNSKSQNMEIQSARTLLNTLNLGSNN